MIKNASFCGKSKYFLALSQITFGVNLIIATNQAMLLAFLLILLSFSAFIIGMISHDKTFVELAKYTPYTSIKKITKRTEHFISCALMLVIYVWLTLHPQAPTIQLIYGTLAALLFLLISVWNAKNDHSELHLNR